MKFIIGHLSDAASADPRWLNLVAGSDSAAIRLTPLTDWTVLERLRNMARETQNGKTFLNMREFLRLLVDATNPIAWRGFETPDGTDADFSPEALLTALYSNETLATLFMGALGNDVTERQNRQARLVKNSDAGRGTSSTTPGKTKTPQPSV